MIRSFDELSLGELYAVLKLRQDVFIVEQECYYPDIDDADFSAVHMLVRDQQSLVGYQRFFAPGVQGDEAVIGRIIVAEAARGTGLGYELVRRGIAYCCSQWASNIRIAAQSHLQDFYRRNGFETISEPRLVDGIPHVDMLWQRGANQLPS